MIEPTKLIGIAGPAGSGKTQVARALSEHGFVRMSFSAPIKDMLHVLFDYLGVDESRTDRYLYGDLKDAPVPEFHGASTRYMMQTLGTEWARDMIDDTLWLRIMERRLKWVLKEHSVVVDDVRFQDEVDLLHSLGGSVFLIRRSLDEIDCSAHRSERGVIGDFLIDNNGCLDDAVSEIIRITFCGEASHEEMV